MPFSWLDIFQSGSRRQRRRKKSLSDLQALESRTLLSATAMGASTPSVNSPKVYGPLQLETTVTQSQSETSTSEATPASAPISVPPKPEDYNGNWSLELGTNFDLKINSKATKIKGKFHSSFFGDVKFKGDLNGLDVTGTAKGKTVFPTKGRGKLVIYMTFTLIDPTHWSGNQETYFKNEFINVGIFGATITPM